jgi:threonine dehydrogenase-like Zn-dependent dehydrogenase
MGVNDLQVNTVADPRIVNPHDAIVKVRLTTTCGSDLPCRACSSTSSAASWTPHS